MKKAFTLIEMLVVMGIIAILVGATIGAFAGMTKSAEKARCQELVSNTATALAALFQDQGVWPKKLRTEGAHDGELNEAVAVVLARGGYMSLSTDGEKLTGYDRLGIVSPWATAVIKQRGTSATTGDRVGSGGTIRDHILHYALDLDGDGIIEGVNVGGASIDVRATAIVWCCGKDGKMEKYSVGLKRDDVYSWTYGQTQNVK